MISLDSETTGIDLYHSAAPFLITSSNEDAEVSWWEWDVDPLTREPLIIYEDLIEIQQLIDDADLLVLQNPKFDVTALQRGAFFGRLKWDWSKVRDTLLAGHLLASNHAHTLDAMAMECLSINIQPLEQNLKQACNEARRWARRYYPDWFIAKKHAQGMPSAVGEPWKYDLWLPRAIANHEGRDEDHPWWTICRDYANGDAAVTLPLYLRQEQLLKERGLWKIYLERLKLLPIICSMEERGVTISSSRLKELKAKFSAEAERSERLCLNTVGRELLPKLPKSSTSKALKAAMFEHLKLPIQHWTKTGEPAINKQAMDTWALTLEAGSKQAFFVSRLRDYRQCSTALGYLESYQRYWVHHPRKLEDWRILHPNINPTGTDTLRMSSNNPNEQNISKQGYANLRYAFGPIPGRCWYSLDYENIELRIPAYESNEEAMIEVFENPNEPPYFGSYHLLNASIVYPDEFWPLADQAGIFKEKYKSTLYQWIKNFGFAIQYGALPSSGTADRAARKPGAHRLVADKLKKHSALNNLMIKYAEEHGYVETIPDQEIDPEHGYPLLCTRSRDGRILPTVPLNYHVQGTACWVKARAMVKAQPCLEGTDCHLIMEVHDELVFDCPDTLESYEVIQQVQRIMESIGDCIGVPLKVSISYHPHNWAESQEPVWTPAKRSAR